MDMRFETWDVRSIYRVCSLKTVASELAKYNLDLMAVQEVRWVKGGRQQMIIDFAMEMGMLIIT
jgi:exonuclease III